jgi:uroporphyrinogen decarboxylase
VLGFPRLAGMYAGAYAERTGVDGVGLDTGTDAAIAAASVPEQVAIQGNLDPMALIAGGAALRKQVELILGAMRGRAHIFNLGHGILPQTPPDHVAELLASIRERT